MSADSDVTKVENSLETFVCESCGESFSCGSKIGKCWCFDVEIEKETLENLKKEYISCLCGNCLENYYEITSRT